MLHCTVKFCGGCNPRYDRGAAYQTIQDSLSNAAVFSYPEDGVHYDLLLIIRGCTGCPYLYEEIDADRRIVLTDQSQLEAVLCDIQNICRDMAEEDDKDEES